MAGRVLLAVLATPVAAAGQSIVGTVTEGGSGRPAVGAMVRLSTERGPAGARWLTGPEGRYTLRAPGPGEYWLEVERIGFETARHGPVAVGSDETVPVELEAATTRVELDAVPDPPEPGEPRSPPGLPGRERDPAARGCVPGEAMEGASRRVWNEARKALAAATWTSREEGLGFTLEQRVRTLDASGRTVTDEERRELRTPAGNPVRSLPPDDLARGGYVRERDGLVHYYAPDAEALLSDSFLRTHCFRVDPEPVGEPHLVGLAFEPVPGRDVTDVAGVLLLDRATARLDRVEFRYTGLPAGPGRDRARGTVRFLELAHGRWVVREWQVRAPVPVLERRGEPGEPGAERLVVGSVQEFGRAIVAVQGPDGLSWRADRAVGALRGVVWDSIRGGPLAGARVSLAGQARLATTDAEGRWALEGVPVGRYRVTFDHPVLDSLGVEPEGEEVGVEADAVRRIRLAVPSLGRILARACPEPGGGVVVGFVRDATGRALAGVEVVAAAEGGGGVPVGTVTDAGGSFRLCGLPADREVAVEAVLGPILSSQGVVRTVAGTAVRVDLQMAAAMEIRSEADTTAAPTLEGTVVEAGTSSPLQGVEVELVDEEGEVVGRAVTDGEGGFRIRPGPPGRYRLRTGHLGYGPVEGHPVELGAETRRVEIRLAPAAVAVEGVVVEVESRSRGLELVGFYDRREQGMGLLLDREDLDAMNLTETGDIVHRVPGLATVPQSTRGSMDTNRRFLMFRRAARASGCMPAIFVDGNRIRQGGEWDRAMPTLDEIIPADEVEALELYEGPATTPSRFSSMGGACGVVVIWSRSTPEGRR